MSGPATPPPGAAPGPGPATVTVAGAAMATAVPDTAVLELGVETRGSTPAEALDACARALDQVLAALEAEGVPPVRRATGGLQLQEDWESRQPGRGPVGDPGDFGKVVCFLCSEPAGFVSGTAVGVDGATTAGLL